MPHLYAKVKGRVQGVGFRYFVSDIARKHDLTGYVRNLPDGDVEVEAEGAENSIDHLINQLKRGPALSRVTDVDTQISDEEQGYGDFRIAF